MRIKRTMDRLLDAQRMIEHNTEAAGSVRSTAGIVFVVMAEDGRLDDTTITEHAAQFPVWDEHWRGKAGQIVQDEGALYRSIHDVTDAGQNRKPSATPSMWTKIGDPADEWPEWSQPIGQHDAWPLAAKVSHKGERWTSDYANNVWEPGVFGWTKWTGA